MVRPRFTGARIGRPQLAQMVGLKSVSEPVELNQAAVRVSPCAARDLPPAVVVALQEHRPQVPTLVACAGDSCEVSSSSTYERVCVRTGARDLAWRLCLASAGMSLLGTLPSHACPGDEWAFFGRSSRPDDAAVLIQGMPNSNVDAAAVLYFCAGCTPVDGTWSTQDIEAVAQRQRVGKFCNNQNVYFQVKGVLMGLQRLIRPHAAFRFVIKARSDEYYSDVGPVLARLRADGSRIVTNNVFFRKSRNYVYHASDHLIAGSVDNMLAMFEAAVDALESGSYPRDVLRVAEQVICGSYIRRRLGAGGQQLPRAPEDARALMLRYFDCVPLRMLGTFRVTANCMRMVVDNESLAAQWADKVVEIDDVRDM